MTEEKQGKLLTDEKDFYENLLFNQVQDMQKKMKDLTSKGNPSDKDIEFSKRLADLEIKMARLWELLISENTYTKTVTLNKFGRSFKDKFKK